VEKTRFFCHSGKHTRFTKSLLRRKQFKRLSNRPGTDRWTILAPNEAFRSIAVRGTAAEAVPQCTHTKTRNARADAAQRVTGASAQMQHCDDERTYLAREQRSKSSRNASSAKRPPPLFAPARRQAVRIVRLNTRRGLLAPEAFDHNRKVARALRASVRTGDGKYLQHFGGVRFQSESLATVGAQKVGLLSRLCRNLTRRNICRRSASGCPRMVRRTVSDAERMPPDVYRPWNIARPRPLITEAISIAFARSLGRARCRASKKLAKYSTLAS
jgi:hypothetical protein